MSRSAGVHDTLVYRLSQVLTKLNQGESLDPQALADEFGVTLRTIQRDLNVRFGCLPLVKSDGCYRLEEAHLGKLTIKDLEQFAALSGVAGLFPKLSDRFLRGVFDAGKASAWLVKGHHYEDVRGQAAHFVELEQAIIQRHHVQFRYNKAPGQSKHHSQVEPYKLVNHKGIWYLAAWEDGSLKSFSVTKVEALRTEPTTFLPRQHVDSELAENDSIWLGGQRQRVLVQISGQVSGYFTRRNLLPNQAMERVLADGDLLLSTTVMHPDEILPIIRFWIPHARIIDPPEFQEQMESGLTSYLQRSSTTE